MRQREDKNYCSFRPYPPQNRKFQKNSKKIQKIKNTIMASFQTKIGWKMMRQEEKKILDLFRPYPTRNIKFQKK